MQLLVIQFIMQIVLLKVQFITKINSINTLPIYTGISSAVVGNTTYNTNCITKNTIYNTNQYNQYLAKLHKYFKYSCW